MGTKRPNNSVVLAQESKRSKNDIVAYTNRDKALLESVRKRLPAVGKKKHSPHLMEDYGKCRNEIYFMHVFRAYVAHRICRRPLCNWRDMRAKYLPQNFIQRAKCCSHRALIVSFVRFPSEKTD